MGLTVIGVHALVVSRFVGNFEERWALPSRALLSFHNCGKAPRPIHQLATLHLVFLLAMLLSRSAGRAALRVSSATTAIYSVTQTLCLTPPDMTAYEAATLTASRVILGRMLRVVDVFNERLLDDFHPLLMGHHLPLDGAQLAGAFSSLCVSFRGSAALGPSFAIRSWI